MARTRFDIPEVPSRWRTLRWLLLLGLPLPLFYGLTVYHAQGVADRAILLSLGAGKLEHGLSWVDLNGHVRSKDIVFSANGSTSIWRAATVDISLPGWSWWIGQSVNFDLRTRQIARLQVSFSGIDAGADRAPALGELRPIGVSAAPFETEGCSGSQHWSDQELREMEIDPRKSRLSFDFRTKDQGLETQIAYEVADSSSSQMTRWQRLPMPLTVLLVDQFPRLTQQEKWQIQDQGFIRKRTKYCAQRDSISQREMIERHLQSVNRLLEMVGIEPVPVASEFYRLYARDGGDLSLELRYPEPWAAHPDATLGLDQETLAASHATMQRGEESAAFLWPSRPVRALAEWSSGMPTYAAMQQELDKGSVDLGIESATPPLWSQRPAARLDLDGLGLPDLDGAYRLLTNAPAEPAAETQNSEPAPEAAAPAEPTAELVVQATVPTPAATSPPAKPSTGESTQIPAPRTVIIGKQHRDFAWDELPGLVGKRLRITTQSGAQRYADLIEAGEDEILIRTRIGGGIAEYRIKREAFRSASLAN